MLKIYTVEEHRKLYEALPKKIQRLFWEEDVVDKITKLVERFDLGEKETEKIMQIVSFIYYGILPPSHLKKVVVVEIGIDKNSEAIASEITRLLIAPYYLILKDLYEKEEFEKIGINAFSNGDNRTKNERSSFGDIYREPIE